MSKRDIFKIIIKLGGLYLMFILLVDIVFTIVDLGIPRGNRDYYIFAYLILMLGIYFYFLVYKPDLIIDWLKLDKGFDTDRFEWGGLSKTDFFEVAVFFLGAYFFIDALPPFLVQIFLAFKAEITPSSELMDTLDRFTSRFGVVNYKLLLQDALYLVLGYLIMTNYDIIARKFFGRQKQ